MIRLFRPSFGPLIRSTFSTRTISTRAPTEFRDDTSDHSDENDDHHDEFNDFDEMKNEAGVGFEPGLL